MYERGEIALPRKVQQRIVRLTSEDPYDLTGRRLQSRKYRQQAPDTPSVYSWIRSKRAALKEQNLKYLAENYSPMQQRRLLARSTLFCAVTIYALLAVYAVAYEAPILGARTLSNSLNLIICYGLSFALLPFELIQGWKFQKWRKQHLIA